jgi:DNA processing protein
MSEYPLGTRDGDGFSPEETDHRRLSSHLVVVEAPERSGAIITARLAGEMGRELWAVPGRIDEKVCRGSNPSSPTEPFRSFRWSSSSICFVRDSLLRRGTTLSLRSRDGMPEEEDGVFSTLSRR